MSHRAVADSGRPDDPRWSRAIGLDMTPGRFFEGVDVSWRIAPFVLAGLLPFALLPMAGVPVSDPRVLIAAALLALVVALALWVPWSRLPAWPQAILPALLLPHHRAAPRRERRLPERLRPAGDPPGDVVRALRDRERAGGLDPRHGDDAVPPDRRDRRIDLRQQRSSSAAWWGSCSPAVSGRPCICSSSRCGG